MHPIRIVAIPTEVAEAVRESKCDPHYGFPAYTENIKESAPCRHCLERIGVGEKATLFTYDAFAGQENLRLPGPVYIHANSCQRYREDAGFPPEFRNRRTLNAYSRGRRLVAQEYVDDGDVEAKLEQLFARRDVDYVHVRSTDAGCFTFRIERG
jgi:Protein of unknown function (DUF1203)